MSRLKGQSVSDDRMPRGLRLVDESLPETQTAHTAAALPRDAEVPPPSSLPERLHDQWRDVTASLAAGGLLAAADSPMVMVLLREIELFVLAADAAVSEGTTLLNDRGTPVVNPAHSLAQQHAKTIEQLAKSLGLTFVARARLDAPAEQVATTKTPANPFAV